VRRTASLFIAGHFVFKVSCIASVRFVLLQSRLTGGCQILWHVKAFPCRNNCLEKGWGTPRESLNFVQHTHPQAERKKSAFCSHSGRSL
jgi:hypothetical protein